MKTVLVTGGAGFIGSHVVDTLIAHGYRVVVVDNLCIGKEENINPKAIFFNLDICDSKLQEIFAREKIDWVSHHAAQIDLRKSLSDPREDARVNIQGLLNLLENCTRYKVKGVVFASSGGAIYSEPEKLPVAETHGKAPLSPYGVSKVSSEYYLYYYHCVYGLPYIALRYGNVYGPRQDPHGEAGVVAIFAKRMLAAIAPTIFGDGKQSRDYIFINDVASANLLAMRQLSNIPLPRRIDDNAYNIGTSIGTSVNDLFFRLKEMTRFSDNPLYTAEKKEGLRWIILDISKAYRELSWKPLVSLTEGLRKTTDYFSNLTWSQS
ncbi:NAD-dependent epimerase/dehydratase family protein [Chloroflexota bacterium]